jgi:hypothetical protein
MKREPCELSSFFPAPAADSLSRSLESSSPGESPFSRYVFPSKSQDMPQVRKSRDIMHSIGLQRNPPVRAHLGLNFSGVSVDFDVALSSSVLHLSRSVCSQPSLLSAESVRTDQLRHARHGSQFFFFFIFHSFECGQRSARLQIDPPLAWTPQFKIEGISEHGIELNRRCQHEPGGGGGGYITAVVQQKTFAVK